MDSASFLLAALLVTAHPAPPSSPSPVCIHASAAPAMTIAGLRGDYRVVGSNNDRPYSGQLVLSGAEDSDSLRIAGEVDGSIRQGTALYVYCGPDRVRQLKIELTSGQVLYCVPHNDYDNFNRLSCSASLSDPNGDHELWVQQHRP